MLKRIVDLVLALFFLITLFPFLLLLAALVKIDSPGPVFFRQLRAGRGFVGFSLLKFRTMRFEAEGPVYVAGCDPRLTRVGRWLRRTKLDELPQLWNVVRGEMSFVGARPVVPELAEEFRIGYEALLEGRPGLTDPATLKYCREGELLAMVASPERFFRKVATPDKVRISLSYTRQASMGRDLLLIVQTARVVFLLLGDALRELCAERAPRPPRQTMQTEHTLY